MFLKTAYQILFLQPLMALNFLLDLEVVQLMMVAMMAQMMELMTVVMMVERTVIQRYVYLLMVVI